MAVQTDHKLVIESAEMLFQQSDDMLKKAEAAKTDVEKRLYADMARQYLAQGMKLTAALKTQVKR